MLTRIVPVPKLLGIFRDMTICPLHKVKMGKVSTPLFQYWHIDFLVDGYILQTSRHLYHPCVGSQHSPWFEHLNLGDASRLCTHKDFPLHQETLHLTHA